LDRPPEPLVERDERRVAEQPLALRDVREGVGHVARARRPMLAREAASEDRLELRDDLEQAHPVAAADVEHLAADARGARGEQVGFDDDAYTTRAPRARRAASSTLRVPVTLSSLAPRGSFTDRGTDRIAAWWKTTRTPRAARSTTPRCRMSPRITSSRPLNSRAKGRL